MNFFFSFDKLKEMMLMMMTMDSVMTAGRHIHKNDGHVHLD
jgi:hypothetical protein